LTRCSAGKLSALRSSSSFRPFVLSSFRPFVLLSFCPIVLLSFRTIVLSSFRRPFVVPSSRRPFVLSSFRTIVLSSFRRPFVVPSSRRPFVILSLVVLSLFRGSPVSLWFSRFIVHSSSLRRFVLSVCLIPFCLSSDASNVLPALARPRNCLVLSRGSRRISWISWIS
jgi:hypothetical protein